MSYRVLIAAGGTGGHMIPAQVLAEQLHAYNVNVEFVAAGLSENRFFEKNRWVFREIRAAPPSVRHPLNFCTQMTKGLTQSLNIVKKNRPDLIVGFGSYHTVPLLASAALCSIPMVLYAADAIPGRVIRCFSPFAKWTGCFFEEASSRIRGQTKVVRFPLRMELSSRIPKEKACAFFGLPETLPVVLVMGGSQGSKVFNEKIPLALHALSREVSVIHLCGHGSGRSDIEDVYRQHRIPACVRAFEPQMQYAFSAADVVIARAGASAIAEIEAFSLPALYIPFPFATDNHQYKNASFAVCRGLSMMLNESEASTERISSSVQRLLAAPVKKDRDTQEKLPSLVDTILETLNKSPVCRKK